MSFHASQTDALAWIMFIGAAVIFLLVLALLGFALYGPPDKRARLGRRGLILAAGIAFPVMVLSALLAWSLGMVAQSGRGDAPAAMRIEVVGEMWWWRLRYLDRHGSVLFETANDIRIPVNVPVELVLKSDNVIHSFWVPELAGKLDMVPGHVNYLRIQASRPGLYPGQCAEYCGAQHAKMRLQVRVLTAEAFQAWASRQRLPARQADTATRQRGKQAFTQHCARCHTIRGTDAAGTLGPDLTHVGSRDTLAAGTLPNSVGALAGWISDSQDIKPGNLMPAFDQLTGADLGALAEYMESLE